MTSRLSRRTLLAGILTSAALPLQAGAPTTSIRPRMRPDLPDTPRPAAGATPPPAPKTVSSGAAMVEKANISGESAFALAALANGQMLETHEAARGQPPASVAKTMTTMYALRTLGPDYRFQTRLLGTGPLQDGKLMGDLILAGGGDPDLDTDDLASMVSTLKAAGVVEVTGRFLYWGHALPEARLIDDTQPDQESYNPGISGLNLNYNRVHFQWKKTGTSWEILMDARSGKYRPDVTIATMTLSDRAAPVYTLDDRNGRDEWSVAQGALGADGSRWLPVRRPAAYCAEVFQTLARSYGIVLKAPEDLHDLPEDAFQLVIHEGQPLSHVIKEMLFYSTNLTAEIIGLTASTARGVKPTSLRSSAQAMSIWARGEFGMQQVAMVDHSGLEDASRVSTGDLVRMLSDKRTIEQLRPLLKEIHLRDQGKKPDPKHPLQVHAKTGTLNFVSGLAGYLVGPDGTEMAFAILSGDTDIRDSLTKAQRERPPGGRPWLARARNLQQDLIVHWGGTFGMG